MRSIPVTYLFLLLPFIGTNALLSFAQPTVGVPSSNDFASRNIIKKQRAASGSTTALQSMSISTITSALDAGPYGILALTGVASSVVVPLTLYRQAYSFSVGYGLSVAAMGFAVLKNFDIGFSCSPLSLMSSSVIFYGIRLGLHLLVRELTVPSQAESLKAFDKSPLLQRIPFAVSVSLFYAFMTSPLMYAARAATTSSTIMNVGVGLAWLGAIMEGVADLQKFLVKRSAAKEGVDDTFVGPTGGLYTICRHPNYLGEVLFWFGLAVAGAPSFGRSLIAWGCATLGFYGIFGIMTGAAKRLDKKQEEKYSDQDAYIAWKEEVKAPLFPFTK